MRDVRGGRVERATLALLFSDIEGSTRLLQQLGPAYSELLLEHRRLLRDAFAAHGGIERGTEGDSFFVTFSTASEAAAAALAAQRSLLAHDWPGSGDVRVRMGLHAGSVELVAGSVVGMAVHEAARIASAAHGGQVLASQTFVRLAEPLPAGAGWQDLGRHRLKDVPEPVAVAQLRHDDLPAQFPPPRSRGGGRNNLPAQPTSFVGRAEEIAAVEGLLATSRLLTVTGTGGVGKSRIALRVASAQGDRHEDGVFLVELTNVSHPEAVEAQVASTLGLGDVAGLDLPAALGERDLLVVLDNCEHVIEAAGDLAARLLRGCPGVRLLATSREPLGVPGEVVWRVPPLSEDDAVELLAARAQAVSSRFTVTEDNAAAVREVCRRLDAIPLALELAAARLGTLSVEQLSGRLDRRFRLLSGGVRGVLERHRTLQATVDWSYELLEEDEQSVLRRAGVFAAGFDLDAMEAVCGEHDPADVLDLVDRLVRKSLVVVDERPTAMRYRLLETVRQYALDRLVQGGGLVTARDAHLRWVRGLATEAAEVLWLGGDETRWMARLDEEDANLRAALEWALERDEPSAALRILFGVFAWLTARGRAREGLDLVRRCLATHFTGPDLALANLLLLCFESNVGVIDRQSVAAVGATVALLGHPPHEWLRPLAQAYVTAWSYPAGDAAAAAGSVEACRAAVEEVRGCGPGATAWCLQPLVWVLLDAGQLPEARAAADEALAAATAAGSSIGESRMALNVARIAFTGRDLDAAWTFAERAVLVARRTGEGFVVSAATQLLSDVAQWRGEPVLARDLLVSVLDTVAETQPPDALTALRERIAAAEEQVAAQQPAAPTEPGAQPEQPRAHPRDVPAGSG